MYKRRLTSNKLRQFVETFPAVIITGARQVGKSTLLEKLFGGQGDYVLFDPVIDVSGAREDPDLFLDNHPTRPLILDEIQYAPELVPAIKRRIDRDRQPGSFVITGSQQWEVMKSLSESLAGRAVFLDLEGFSLSEIAEQTGQENWLQTWLEKPGSLGEIQPAPDKLKLPHTLYETLWRGFLPESTMIPQETVPAFHQAYLRTYIERDVRLMTQVEDWQQFGRFVRLSAALTAQEINYSQFGRDIGVTPQTAKRWLATLKATFQWYEVPPFTGNVVKRISGKPKGFIADTGFACAAQAISSPRALEAHPLFGALFETAVFAELRKLSSALPLAPQIYHWRSAGGAEVDLLLEFDGTLYPIEVKSKSNPSRRDTSGISAFRKTYKHLKVAPGLVIAPTEAVRRLSDRDFCLPWNIRIP